MKKIVIKTTTANCAKHLKQHKPAAASEKDEDDFEKKWVITMTTDTTAELKTKILSSRSRLLIVLEKSSAL